MRHAFLALLAPVALSIGCSSGSGSPSPGGSGGGGPGGGNGGSSSSTGGAGNPDGSCSAGVPAEGQPADTSSPTTVVGTGTASSCTFAALRTAAAAGGVITFDCGGGNVTIQVTETLSLPINKNTVIDGSSRITLDGGGTTRIITFDSPNWRATDFGVTLQHIRLVNGKAMPTEAIPTAPAPCSQGWNDGQGGAVYMRDGYLTVIDTVFDGNQAAPLGPDTGGGAIYVQGSKGGVWIVGSTFTNNSAANAGAVGGLFAELNIYNSLFMDNHAHRPRREQQRAEQMLGDEQRPERDRLGRQRRRHLQRRQRRNVTLCGDAITNNTAGMNAFGGGLFFTSNNYGGSLSIADTTMTGNTGGHWTNVQSGSVTNAGTAVGTNTKSISITSSTIQGVAGVP